MWMPMSILLLIIFALVLFGVGRVAMRRLARRGSAEYASEAERLKQIASLPLESAALEAERLLSTTTTFEVVISPLEHDLPTDQLPPEARRFFERYERIE